MTAVNLVVTCTDRKTLPVPEPLRLRNYRRGPFEEFVGSWLRALQETPADRVPARELYCGDHWSVVCQYDDAARDVGLRATTWVSSAGYGLISSEAPIAAYGATFAAADDSIHRGQVATVERAREWWRALGRWRGPQPQAPRTLAELARSSPRTPLVVVGAPGYVRAMADDLADAADALAEPDLLTVISSKASATGALAGHVVVTDARLQTRFDGSLISLNARVALDALRHARERPLRVGALRAHYSRLVKSQPKAVAHDREPLSDENVRRFLRAELKRNPKARHSPLLRALRGTGHACEQKRFRALFEEVTGGAYGS